MADSVKVAMGISMQIIALFGKAKDVKRLERMRISAICVIIIIIIIIILSYILW